LVRCISRLFFDTHIIINVKSFLFPRFAHRGGLKQGNPISPILFNLSSTQLLRRILQ
ncbi:hypothetical protein BD408DRAFT_319276, partial [Parasitella parasitica]